MPTLDELLQNEILTPEQKEARVAEVLAGTMPGALRQYGQTSQAQNEAAFGKGMGLSTWNAYQQALNSLMEAEGAGKIRNDARTSVDAAQRAALGNAVSYATAERNRAANTAASNQSADIQRKGLAQQKSLAGQSMLFSGLSGLGGGVANIGMRTFGPEIKSGLKGLFGGAGTPGAPKSPATESAPNVEMPYGAGIDQDTAAGPEFGASFPSGLDLYGSETSLPSFGGDYSLDVAPLSFDFGGDQWSGLDALLMGAYDDPYRFAEY